VIVNFVQIHIILDWVDMLGIICLCHKLGSPKFGSMPEEREEARGVDPGRGSITARLPPGAYGSFPKSRRTKKNRPA